MRRLIGFTILAISLIYGTSHGATYAEWGIASTHPGTKDPSQVKWAEFGEAGESGKLAYSVGGGGWIDKTTYVAYGKAAQSAFYGNALFGVMPKAEHFYMSYKLGPAYVSRTDALLGSNLQIAHEFGIGFKDDRNVRIGFVVKHMSNGGIVKPNQGRDFAGVRIEF